MLKHSRDLVDSRHQRHGRKRIYAPRIKWSKWLHTGGEEEEAMPTTGRKVNRRGRSEDQDDENDETTSTNSKKTLLSRSGDLEQSQSSIVELPKQEDRTIKAQRDAHKSKRHRERLSTSLVLRGKAADALEWIQDSEDLLYATKLCVAVFLVIWPAFVATWNSWYSLNRGVWAALQLILITEVSIGTSVMTFILRGIGTTLGCLWGWAAVEAQHGNRIVCAAMICLGCIPFAYVQLGTKYPKAGMVSIVSICVVALASELETVPGQ